MYYCENILNNQEVEEIYNELFKAPRWLINNPYNHNNSEDGIYCQSIIQNSQSKEYDPYLFGLFKGIAIGVNKKLKEKYNFSLDLNNENIIRTQLNAQKKSNFSQFHTDGIKGVESYSIIGFLTPYWDKMWGGQLQIEDKKFNFAPGDFIVFDSKRLHDALPVIKETPFYRVTVAMFVSI
jgi:Rps23 Pro-64 3,4-dihydroxylase Tpa1-like proline 4-hydroxylase